MHKLLAIEIVLFLSGCLDASTPTPPEPSDDQIIEISRDVPVGKADDVEDEDDRRICDLLPEDGACSLACDPEKMIELHVPAGTCALFHCTLTDGSTYDTGGCNR